MNYLRQKTTPIAIPLKYFDAFYDASKHPQSGRYHGLRYGSNCQCFVYELMRHFGFALPQYRSSELWEDKEYTKKVKTLKPLDIVFFNKARKSYGAHLGLYLGHNKVIHLSKEVGYPTVWDFSDFMKRARYKVFIGAKRATRPLP